jgi:hypothetical protein
MKFADTAKKKFMIAGIALALTTGAGVTAASANGSFDEVENKGVTFQVGAEDLNGNPVNSKVLITDTLPNDLGTLEFSGEAVAGDEPQTGTFK